MAADNNNFFNILPGKIVKKRFTTVCLDYGMKDPAPRIDYRLVPLTQYTSNKGVELLLSEFGKGRYSQQTAQLAAWHLANDKSWDELARVPYTRATGRRIPRYTSKDIALAKKMVAAIKWVPSKPKSPRSAGQPERSLAEIR